MNQNAKRLSGRRGVLRLPVLMVMALCCALFFASRAQAQGGSTLVPVEAWSTVFGEQKIVLHFLARGVEKPARADWALAFEGRVLARGEVTPGPAGEISIPVSVPPVKPGVVLPLTLSVSIAGDNNVVVASVVKRLTVYPRDAFAEKMEWLKTLNLRLYDPDGLTARRLDEAKIPFTRVGNADALAEGEPGIAIIGEGLSFEEHRALPEAMVRIAASGRTVLCLAPTAGVLPLPGSEGIEGAVPSTLKLRRADVITELDKHLDIAWPKGLVENSLVLKAARDQVVVELERGGAGWNWLECDYTHARSALVVCNFNIMAQWDDSPTPRFLFARLLNYLNDYRTTQNIAAQGSSPKEN